MYHDTETTSSKRKLRKYESAIDTSCAFETNDLNLTTANFDSYGKVSFDPCAFTLHTAVNAEIMTVVMYAFCNTCTCVNKMVTIRHQLMLTFSGRAFKLSQIKITTQHVHLVNFFSIDHYKKYKNFKPQLECCICDKSIYSQRFVGILDDKIDMLNIYMYINQILQIEKNVVKSTFCKTSVYLSCYKHFNIFLRSEESDLTMVRTDQFLEDCFSQYEVIQTNSLDSSNVEIFCFRQPLEYVIENFKSYRPLLVSSLHLKYKNIVYSSIQDFSINIDNESVCRVHKTTNWVYQMLKSTLGPTLLVYSPPRKAQVEWCTELVQICQKPCTLPSCITNQKQTN